MLAGGTDAVVLNTAMLSNSGAMASKVMLLWVRVSVSVRVSASVRVSVEVRVSVGVRVRHSHSWYD